MKKITLSIAAILAAFTMNAQEVNVNQKESLETSTTSGINLSVNATNATIIDYPIGQAGSGFNSALYLNANDQVLLSSIRATNFTLDNAETIKAINIFGFNLGEELGQTLQQYEIYIFANGANNLPDTNQELYSFVGSTNSGNGYQLVQSTDNAALYTQAVSVLDGGLDLPAGTYWLMAVPVIEYAGDPNNFSQNNVFYWFLTDGTADYSSAVIGDNGFESFEPQDQNGNPTGESTYFAFEMLDEENNMAVTNLDKDQFMHVSTNTELILSANTPIENVKVYNLLGQEVASQAVNNTNTQVNIANLQTGVYIAQVKVNGETKTFKFAKK